MNVPTILLYRQINTLSQAMDPNADSVTPWAFAEQMAYLADNSYTVLSLSKALRWMHEGSLPDKCIVITFNVGYRDMMTNALPTLERYGFPATVFVVADYVGKTAAWRGAIGMRTRLLSWDEMADMTKHNIEFGSQTCTHPRLTRLNIEDAKRELVTSKRIIENHLQIDVKTLAYPYERLNHAIMTLAEQAGYDAACGTRYLTETRYNLWRVPVRQVDDLTRFKSKLSPLWKSYAHLRKHLRPLRMLLS